MRRRPIGWRINHTIETGSFSQDQGFVELATSSPPKNPAFVKRRMCFDGGQSLRCFRFGLLRPIHTRSCRKKLILPEKIRSNDVREGFFSINSM